MDLEGKKVVVVGLALTGVAVAKFCARRGARVIVTDGKPADKLAEQMKLLDGVPVTWELGGHELDDVHRRDLVVMSPGVPTLPEMTRRARGRRRGHRRDRARVSLPRSGRDADRDHRHERQVDDDRAHRQAVRARRAGRRSAAATSATCR